MRIRFPPSISLCTELHFQGRGVPIDQAQRRDLGLLDEAALFRMQLCFGKIDVAVPYSNISDTSDAFARFLIFVNHANQDRLDRIGDIENL